MNDNKDKLDILDFKVYGDLSKYTDSLLFQDETIASLLTKEYKVTIEVIGDVRISFDGDTYRYSSDFPEELRKIIEKGDISEHSEIEIIDNNWFEIDVYERTSKDKYVLVDDEVFEEDLSKMTQENLKKYMQKHLKDYLGIEDEINVTNDLESDVNLNLDI